MKIEQAKTWKVASRVAAVVVLGAVASAQAGMRKGQVLTQVSMANDIRTPELGRGMIVLQRPAAQRPLQLALKMRHRTQGLDGLMPSLDDMETTLVLENGTPGGIGVIHLDTRAPELRAVGGGKKIVGFFDADGHFPVVLSSGQARGVFAHGEEVTWWGLRLKAAAQGGRAVPASERPKTDDMDVEKVVNEAYHNFARRYAELYTRLQFGKGGLRQSGSLDAKRVASPASALAVTIRTPALGGGHVLPGTAVENDLEIGEDQFVDLPDPSGAKRAFGKIQLQRPQAPAKQDGHVLQRKL
jgi:hypothetical protein